MGGHEFVQRCLDGLFGGRGLAFGLALDHVLGEPLLSFALNLGRRKRVSLGFFALLLDASRHRASLGLGSWLWGRWVLGVA